MTFVNLITIAIAPLLLWIAGTEATYGGAVRVSPYSTNVAHKYAPKPPVYSPPAHRPYSPPSPPAHSHYAPPKPSHYSPPAYPKPAYGHPKPVYKPQPVYRGGAVDYSNINAGGNLGGSNFNSFNTFPAFNNFGNAAPSYVSGYPYNSLYNGGAGYIGGNSGGFGQGYCDGGQALLQNGVAKRCWPTQPSRNVCPQGYACKYSTNVRNFYCCSGGGYFG